MKNKKELIMKSVMSLVKENGIKGLTVSVIAKHAGIGKGTIYEYFSCKEDIFFAAMEYGISSCVKEISEKTFINQPNYKQAINNFINISYEIVKSGVFIAFTTNPKLFTFDSYKFDEIREMMTKQFEPIITVSHKINKIGIDEDIVKEPINPLTHFIFVNMILSTVMQIVHGTIKKGNETNDFLYQMALKLFN
ncbi:MAG: TetR/AcrR family transcriptional regulator [Clostridiales bacterium]|nr:TetR/AcrR family transcriptional regulator [Clostridiales bacterium]